VISGGPVRQAKAQAVGGIPDLGIELSTHFAYDYTQDSYAAQVMYARIATPEQIDPNFKGVGTVYTIFLKAGVRTPDLTRFDFRWRAGLIDMDLIRTPLSMGISLIDYNESGLLETDVRWINLRLGPSFFLGNQRTHVAVRTVGLGGITTLKMGTFSYSGLGSAEDLRSRKRSYEIGYLGEARILLADLVSVSGLFQFRNVLDGLRPKFYQVTGKLGVKVSSLVSFQGLFSIEEAQVSRSSITRYVYGGSLSLVF